MLKKIFSILDKNTIKKLGLLFVLIIISSLLDLVGISIILPIVSLILSNGTADTSNVIIDILVKVFKTNNTDTLMTITVLLLIILFFVKSAYGIFFSYISNRYSQNYSRRLTKKLMDTYLSMPYEYHLENNSSTLIRKSIYDVNYFVYTIGDLMSLLVKGLTFIVIFAYLVKVSWLITLITCALLLIFSILTIFILKPKTKKIAMKVQELNSDNYKYLSQAFLGIKESKISGTEKNFSNVYDDNRKNINDLTLQKSLISSLPSNLIEFVGILCICISLLFLKNVISVEAITIVTTFSVFVYAVMKLLPLVISSTGIFNNFTYYKTSVDTLYEDIEKAKEFEEMLNEENVEPLNFVNSIDINNVSFAYNAAKDKVVLNNINLSIKKNSIVAFFGPSGGGKTTLIDLILGLLEPTSGSITVDNVDITKNFKAWRQDISYIPQTIYLSDDTIRRNVAFGLKDEEIDNDKVIEALKKAELDEFVNSLKDKENSIIGENGIRLSGGQRQRIGIARAFYRNTNVIVFDEATSALDYETEKHIFEHVSQIKEDHTLIIITHRENTIQMADSIYKIEDNKLNIIK